MESIFGRFLQGIRTTVRPDAVTIQPALVHWLDTTPVESHDKPCELQSLDVQARVMGLYAEVTQTLVIQNPNARPISAALAIALPDRSVVCGYALDIDGQMVDGVVVPKEEARVVFETEQRRGADPGLVEAVRGNAYRTRVYPVPALGTRTVRLRYVAPLLLGEGTSATLDLPMPAEHLGRRTVRIEVEDLNGTAPEATGLSGATFAQTRSCWVGETDEKDLTPTEPVRLSVPSLPDEFVLLERDEADTVWFCASALDDTRDDGEPLPQLEELMVLWDASGSRAGQDHARELELVRAYASASTVRRLTLVVFADRVREVRELASAGELVSALRKVRYDGGTDLGALANELRELAPAHPEDRAAKTCVLFTDGIDTLGDEPFQLVDAGDVVALASGRERDVEALRQACRGLAFDLVQAPSDAEALMAVLARARRQALRDVGGQGIADVCDVSSPVGARRAVIGRLTRESALLTLGAGNAPVALEAADATRGGVLAGAWASRRVSVLSPRASENAAELLELGRRFGVVSPVTSLLVLESLDQWLRYDIEPPRTLTTMHEQWERAREGRMRLSSEESRRKQHRGDLARDWRVIMDWRRRDFTAQEPSRTESAHEGHATHIPNFCPTCGQPLDDAARICRYCGHLVPRPSHSGRGRMRLASEDEPLAMADMAMGMDDMAAPVMANMAAPAMASASFGDRSSSTGKASEGPEGPTLSVSVKPWAPDAPYLKALDEAKGPGGAREAYHAQRAAYATSPSFYLDCAAWFANAGDGDFGRTVLTNLAELRIEDAALLRVMAWRLRESGDLVGALTTMRRVAGLRSEDAQSYRDLALVLSELAQAALAAGDEEAARAYAEESGELYRKVALTPWARRARALALFGVEEYNVLRAWAERQAWKQAPELPSLGDDLEGVPDCDLRITLAWDADETDVDIHVTEPSGEEAYYAHRLTSSGGRVSEDITDGFGPELYEIAQARQGTYTIRAHYYASHQQSVFGPATCTLTVYTDWGRATQRQTITTTRLDRAKEMVPVGTASYGTATEGAEEGHGVESPQLEVGMTADEVIALLGEPRERMVGDTHETWLWELGANRELAVRFEDGEVRRVVERMSWGDEMVIAQ